MSSRLSAPMLTLVGALVVGLTVWWVSGVSAVGSIEVRSTTEGPVSVPRDDDRVWHVVAFEPGGRLQIEVPVTHRGALPVRVTDARVARSGGRADCGWAIDEVVLTGPDGDAGPGTQGTTLGRGEVGSLRLAGTFVGEVGCLPGTSAVSRGAVSVELTTLGIPRRQRLPLTEVISWSSDVTASAERFARAPTAPRVNTAP